MFDPKLYLCGLAALIGLAIGVERRWRGFKGNGPLHIIPALVGAVLVTRQTGLTALFWFLPLQVLMWLIVIATVCMWSAERTPDRAGDFRGTGGLGLTWALAFLLGVICAFQAWLLLGCATATLVAFGLRTPRQISAPPAVVAAATAVAPVSEATASAAVLPGEPEAAPSTLAELVEQLEGGKPIGGTDTGRDLKRVDGDAGGPPEPTIDRAVIKAA